MSTGRINEVRLPIIVDLFCSGYLRVMGWKKNSEDKITVWSKGENKLELRPVSKVIENNINDINQKDVYRETLIFYYIRGAEKLAEFEIAEDAWFEQFLIFVNRMQDI